jgi:hypothetical protein
LLQTLAGVVCLLAVLADPPDAAGHGKLFSESEALASWAAAARDEVGRILLSAAS